MKFFMNELRLFISINLDASLKEKICNGLDIVKKQYRYIKWVKSENLHITLKFLGNTPESQIDKLKGQLSNLLVQQKQFTLEFSGIGVFPNMQKTRVIWLGIKKGKENLIKINKSMEESMEVIGFPRETKDFKSHLTLARLKEPLQNTGNIIEQIKIEPLEQKVNKIELMKSELYPSGPVYIPIGEYLLKQ